MHLYVSIDPNPLLVPNWALSKTQQGGGGQKVTYS